MSYASLVLSRARRDAETLPERDAPVWITLIRDTCGSVVEIWPADDLADAAMTAADLDGDARYAGTVCVAPGSAGAELLDLRLHGMRLHREQDVEACYEQDHVAGLSRGAGRPVL